jgi:hypothetical protein
MSYLYSMMRLME